MMQFLLIGFHSVGKASKLKFYYFFLPDGAIFSCLAYKANTRFFPVFCFWILYWINNAAIIVWVCWYRCQSVVCVCMCVCVIFERDKLYCKSQTQALCAPAEFCWHLMEKMWYCAQTKSYRKLIFGDLNLKFGTRLV